MFTDGSGHASGHAASAAIVVETSSSRQEIRLAANYAMSVFEAELQALILGLRCVLGMGGWDTKHKKSLLDRCNRKPSVLWYTDCQSLAGCVERDPVTLETRMRRTVCTDMWHSLDFYERALHIKPVHVPRNKITEQKMTDKMSGECSALLKEYMGVLALESPELETFPGTPLQGSAISIPN